MKGRSWDMILLLKVNKAWNLLISAKNGKSGNVCIKQKGYSYAAPELWPQ